MIIEDRRRANAIKLIATIVLLPVIAILVFQELSEFTPSQDGFTQQQVQGGSQIEHTTVEQSKQPVEGFVYLNEVKTFVNGNFVCKQTQDNLSPGKCLYWQPLEVEGVQPESDLAKSFNNIVDRGSEAYKVTLNRIALVLISILVVVGIILYFLLRDGITVRSQSNLNMRTGELVSDTSFTSSKELQSAMANNQRQLGSGQQGGRYQIDQHQETHYIEG